MDCSPERLVEYAEIPRIGSEFVVLEYRKIRESGSVDDYGYCQEEPNYFDSEHPLTEPLFKILSGQFPRKSRWLVSSRQPASTHINLRCKMIKLFLCFCQAELEVTYAV